MARNNQYFPVKRFLLVALVATGLTTALYAAGIKTQMQQKASEALNLNSTDATMPTVNADGSMGPLNWQANFSNSLPVNSKGNINVAITNVSKGAGKENQGKGKNKNAQEGTRTLTSLLLTVSKIEVHLANLCGSGNITSYPNQSGALVPSPANRKPTDKLTGADKWETLQLNEGNQTIDLVSLAQQNVADQLGLTSLACGRYTEIRLYVSDATASFNNGPEVKLSIPGKANIVRIVRPFEIKAGQTTSVTIEFNSDQSVLSVGDTYILKPVVARMTVLQSAGKE